MKQHYREIPLKRSPDKHATPWHKRIADEGTILLSEVGSSLHGTSVAADDLDLMGVCIEPPEAVIGFENFEQYEWKTAWERPGGRDNRSGPGDTDKTVYSLRKWMRLAMNGNPTVLLLLFSPRGRILQIAQEGEELRERMPKYILSRQAGDRFIGYLKTQRAAMLSHEGKGRDCTRPELIERFGFDTKFAAHMVRLGYQGVELLRTGKITLPMPEGSGRVVRAIRNGEIGMHESLLLAEDLEHDIEQLIPESPLPEKPNYEAINRWLVEIYQWNWQMRGIESDHYGEPY